MMIVATILGAVAAVPLVAQQGAGRAGGQSRPPFGRGTFGPVAGGLALERLDRELGFNDAQKSQIQALITSERTALAPTLSSLRGARRELDTAITQTPADDGLIQAQVTAVSTLQAQIALARAQTEAKIYQLLSTSQQDKVQQWLTAMQQRRQQ
jgi:Spy/CpxP family protein refolding chaperone